ncbi:MAG: hypothetical protein NVSMB56_15920 [Pyrinomonadaceae bacterium]
MNELALRETNDAKINKSEAKSRMKDLLLFVPNLVRLLGSLLADRRVPKTEKFLIFGAVIYVVSPIDLIPDFIPFIGQVDDMYLVALTILRLINYTDEGVVREHWRGGGDIVQITNTIADFATKILPPRVRHIIAARVEMSKDGKLKAVTGK